MIKKPTKEEMYIVNQPRHLMISIILMDYDYYPLPDNIHTGLCKLSEISDIVFIFSDSHFDNSKISKEKITTLYQACAFIDSSGNLPRTIFKALQYDKEIFGKHIGITISRCQDLQESTPKLFENLEKINQSRIIKPVFKIRRLSSTELYNFYYTPSEEKRKKKWKCIFDECLYFYHRHILKSVIFPWTRVDVPDPADYIDCRYCTWGSNSSVLYFRNTTIGIFLEKVDKEFIDTFTDPDPRYLFAGLVKKNGIDCLDYNIEDLDIGKL